METAREVALYGLGAGLVIFTVLCGLMFQYGMETGHDTRGQNGCLLCMPLMALCAFGMVLLLN